jgi:hypothetical protein
MRPSKTRESIWLLDASADKMGFKILASPIDAFIYSLRR